MKQLLALLMLTLLVSLLAMPVLAETELTDIHCDEQSYSTRMPAFASTTFQEGNGLRIWLDEPGYVPNVLIWRRTKDLSDPEAYVRDEYTSYMKEQYGSNLVGTTLFEYYDIGGKRLLGASYIYRGASGSIINQLHLYEVRDDGHVEYNARYVNSEREMTLDALDAAVRYYQPDQAAGSVSAGLEEIICDEQHFQTKVPAGLSSVFQEENGLRIWLDEPGYVPNIVIWRRTSDLEDPETYMKSEYPAYMKERYGNKLVGTTLHEYYDIGGKRLLATSYIYKGSAGYPINQLHLYEVRDDGHVEYHVRYHNSEREMALAALDSAVRYYDAQNGSSGQAVGKITGSGRAASPSGTSGTTGSARTSGSAGSGAKDLNVSAKQPIVSKTTTVKDNRFSMKLPVNWKIQTGGEYMTFCYRAWDPSSPNRSVFMFMKLEPFLKSQAAKNMYKQIADTGAEMYRISSYYPVMESCSLKGLLDALPAATEFAAKYYQSGITINPALLPDITKANLLEKKPSSLPCPDTCKENIIARIAYEDSKGQACEGLVTAQPLDPMTYYLYGVDAWPYTVYLFMGVTCPMGELNELEPVLTDCLSSFNFESSYVKQAIGLSRAETESLLQYGQEMQAAHDAMVDAWSARQKSYDISSQKMSDAILGYDRLYDTQTGEVYRAETGFYDTYDLHRQEYSNANLQLIDSSSQNYYLEGIDYYITK
ncbi:MAG: hypothetical protein IJT77_04145 [Clostridia bacterium]|nr:hypothetical protein [Clostridia bacterium]